MAKILIYGKPNSPLIRQRGLIGQRAGHEIIWFSPHPADLENVTGYHLPKFARNNFIIRAILEPIYLRRVLIHQKPDLVHVHFASKGLSAIPLAKFHPLIVSTMGSDIYPDQGFRGFYAPFIKLLLNHADCITTKSDYMDSALNMIGDYRDKLRRITWGIDLGKFRPDREIKTLRQRLRINSDAFVIFDPRSALPLYNKHIILEAFSSFAKRNRSSLLIISELFGKDAYLQHLRNLVRLHKIEDQVRFLGSIPNDEMPDYYNLSDITVSVPSSDGLPQTIYEAFACGSILIAGDLPQYKDILRNKENAITVRVGDPENLFAAIAWVYDNRVWRDEVIDQNLKYVAENADHHLQADLVNQIYHQFLNQ